VLSRIATVAAWQESGDWHRSVLRLLTGNRDRVSAWARSHPGLDYIPPEATYLAWLGFARTGRPAPPAPELLTLARVHLSAGDEFTQHTSVPSSSFTRLNFATSPAVLEELLQRMDAALEQYS
jgi:cysteine-S-conjugate beta-lyase